MTAPLRDEASTAARRRTALYKSDHLTQTLKISEDNDIQITLKNCKQNARVTITTAVHHRIAGMMTAPLRDEASTAARRRTALYKSDHLTQTLKISEDNDIQITLKNCKQNARVTITTAVHHRIAGMMTAPLRDEASTAARRRTALYKSDHLTQTLKISEDNDIQITLKNCKQNARVTITTAVHHRAKNYQQVPG